VRRVVLLLAAAAVLGGCGGDGGTSASTTAAAGKKVFASAGCAGCHTLSDAGAKGTVGPDLDQLKPSRDTVAAQVKRGGNGMPAFAGKLSDGDIDAVAAYVSGAAAKAGASSVMFERDDTKLSECHGAEDAPCYEQAFGNLVYAEGAGPALATLEKTMGTDDAVALGCHRIAHRMGSAALKRYHDDVGLAFSKGSAVCSSGYYHGILERAFSGVPKSELGAKSKELCSSGTIASDAFLRFQCNHGLGHGLMLTTHYEMPLALDTCDVLGGYDREACQGGVFMENFSSSYGFVSGFLKDDDLVYPCDDVSTQRKPACYLIVTSRILPAVKYDWRKAAAVCQRTEPDWVYMCFRSYGRDAISTNAYRQPVARRLCHFATTYEADCILSVALHIANEEKGVTGANHWCQGTPQRFKVACYAGIGATLALLQPDGRKRFQLCRRLTTDVGQIGACATGKLAP
jgi:cytochrome c553